MLENINFINKKITVSVKQVVNINLVQFLISELLRHEDFSQKVYDIKV